MQLLSLLSAEWFAFVKRIIGTAHSRRFKTMLGLQCGLQSIKSAVKPFENDIVVLGIEEYHVGPGTNYHWFLTSLGIFFLHLLM